MRAFVAVKVEATPAIRRVLFDIEALGRMGVRPVGPGNLHITLKFMGEVDDARCGEMADALRRAAGESGPFELPLTGLGVFPNERYINVVWIGASEGEGREALVRLADEVSVEFERIGFPRSDFSPHLTIARVKGPNPARQIRRMLGEHARTDFGTQAVSEVLLMRSTLTPAGPIYDVEARGRLERATERAGSARG